MHPYQRRRTSVMGWVGIHRKHRNGEADGACPVSACYASSSLSACLAQTSNHST
ncbi:hypothetical protein HZ994_11965 [Akkermansiaceae bacterium]|nr:hypothetical protein HZ994_11965 [Akkermansiaceae bacterium]